MGEPDPKAAAAEAFAGGDARDNPLFLPFLYGSPHGPDVEGAWVGLRGRRFACAVAGPAAPTQLLADVLAIPVEVTDSDEAGARGAAMLAGIGTGQFTDLDQVTDRWVRVIRSQEPRSSQAHARNDRYRRYLAAVKAIQTLNATD